MPELAAPIFIVGHPRSGTTLLASMFDRHSKVAVPPETNFLLPHRRCRIFEDIHDQYPEPDSHTVQVIRNLDLDPKLVWDSFKQGKRQDSRELFTCILKIYAAHHGKIRCGEKSPWHLRYVPKILAWYPDARIICIVRDGRDAVRSMLRMPGHRHGLAWNALEWQRAARLCLKWSRRYPQHFTWARFEDLLRKPETVLRQLCCFAQVEFESRQLDRTVPTAVWKEHENRGEKVNSPLDMSRAFAWRNILNQQQLWELNAFMGRYLGEFGYPSPGLEGAPALLRLKLMLARPIQKTGKLAGGALYHAQLRLRRLACS